MKKELALSRMMQLCSRMEKCRFDVERKLIDWQLPESERNEIISRLEKDNFLSDNRYARFAVKEKIYILKWGRVKARYFLKQKNFSDGIINDAIEEIKEDEYQSIIKEELEKKAKSIKDNDYFIRKGKLLRFAASRGYEYDVCNDLIDEFEHGKS